MTPEERPPSPSGAEADVDAVVHALRTGGLAVFATETLWSLSARADDQAAVQAVFEAKGRPEGVPLAVGFPSWEDARPFVRPTALAERLADGFLPGPLSLVLERADDRLAHVAPGRTTLSVRVPDHPVARTILEAAGPCVMTSANRHGEPDPRTRAEVETALPGLPVAGHHVPGTGTTVVDATGDAPAVLREGAVPAYALTRAGAAGPRRA